MTTITRINKLIDPYNAGIGPLATANKDKYAAANARPGVIMSLNNEKTPKNLYTVFAGVDREATNSARELMFPFPPSSPCIALFKNGELVHMLERHHIEGREASLISDNLKQAYNEYC